MKPTSKSLPRQQAGHFYARPTPSPVYDPDGASLGVIVDRALRLLRRVRRDFVALAASRVDDRRVQHVRAEVRDVEYGRVGVGGVALAASSGGGGSGGGRIATTGHREGPEDRGLLCQTTV